MVRTMENSVPNSSYGTTSLHPSTRATENGDVYHDDLISDFSIISHPSEDTVDPPQGANLDFLNNVEFPAINHHMGMSSITSSAEEIQQQLRDIVKENVELKEALQQNNVTLRHHFATIVNWQEQYNKARIRQKEIIENMRQLTEALQEEKKKLSEELETTKEQLVKDKEQVCVIFEEKDKLLKEAELQIANLKPELESQEVQCLHLEEIVKELQGDVSSLQNDKSKLQSELQEMRKKNNSTSVPGVQIQSTPFLVTEEDMDYAVVHNGLSSHNSDELALMRQTIEAMTEEKTLFVNLLKEEQEQTKQLKVELEKKTEELNKIKEKEREIGASWVRSLTSIAGPPEEAISIMDEGIVKSMMSVNGANTELEKCQVRFESINQQLGQCQERLLASVKGSVAAPPEVQKLWDELCILRTVVKDEQDAKESYKNQLEDAQTRFRSEYQSLVNQWESYKSDIKTQGKQIEALSEIERRQSQERLDELTAKVIHLEESLQEKLREVERTKKRIQMMERELEQIPILRSRNELFQIELQRAEEAKKEKDELIENQKKDVLTLQSQIVQLTDELSQQSAQQLAEIYRRPHKHGQDKGTARNDHHRKHEQITVDENRSSKYNKKCPVHKPGASSNNSSLELVGACGGGDSMPKSNPRSYEDPDKVRTCPRCFANFTGMQALNNHVQKCCFSEDPFI